MNVDQFRKLVLAVPEAEESAHHGHPDFRIGGKIFATLGPDGSDLAMVRLTPDQQQSLCESHAEMFVPCKGAWGKSGCTHVRLPTARVPIVRAAVQMAATNLAARK